MAFGEPEHLANPRVWPAIWSWGSIVEDLTPKPARLLRLLLD